MVLNDWTFCVWRRDVERTRDYICPNLLSDLECADVCTLDILGRSMGKTWRHWIHCDGNRFACLEMAVADGGTEESGDVTMLETRVGELRASQEVLDCCQRAVVVVPISTTHLL
jgi:hypothetical protein